jgi:hypothetical protein
LYTSCVLWVAPLCAFSIYFTYQKKKNISCVRVSLVMGEFKSIREGEY